MGQPWYADIFWNHFRGRGFDPTEGGTNTTLASAIAVGGTSAAVVAATGFVVGESVVIGKFNNWQSFTVAAIVGNTLTIYPKAKGFNSGDFVNHAFGNDTHPVFTLSYAGYAQTLADTKMRRALVGTDRLNGIGALEQAATDARSVANVPVGWESLGTATFTVSSYATTDILPFARSGNGTKINAAAIGDGMRTLAAIAVTAGEPLVAQAMCKHTAGTGFTIKVVDKNSPTTVLGQLAAVMGDVTQFNFMSLGQVSVPFTVPAGVTAVEIRVLATGSSDECYLDDVRLIADRQATTDDRYLFEDPGAQCLAWLGDSWSVGGTAGGAEQFRLALEARFGHPLANWLNAGVSGNTLADMISRFDTDVAPSMPGVVVIEYGANDLSQGRTRDQMTTDADRIIAKCRGIGATPVFACIPPIQSVLATAQLRNEQIRLRASQVTNSMNFHQMTLGAPCPISATGTTFTNYTFVNTTDQLEFIFQVPDDNDNPTVTITQLGYRLASVTGASPVMSISLQGVSAGIPDGTIKGGGTPASATFTPAGTGTWNWVTLANSYTANRGDLLAIVIKYSSGTLNGSNTPVFSIASGALAGGRAMPYGIQNVAGVRTRQVGPPLYGFASASKSFGLPVATVTGTAFDSASTPNERAMRFIIDAAFGQFYKVCGIRLLGITPIAGKTLKAMLYSGTTPIATWNLPTDTFTAPSNTRAMDFYFQDSTLPVLTTGQEYRISLAPQTTGVNIAWYTLDVNAASDMDAFPAGQTWYLSTRSGGAWTDVVTSRPIAELIISEWAQRPPGIIVPG